MSLADRINDRLSGPRPAGTAVRSGRHGLPGPVAMGAAAAREQARRGDGQFGVQERPEAQPMDLMPEIMAAGEAYRRGVEEAVHTAGGVTSRSRARIDELSREHENRLHAVLSTYAARTDVSEADARMAVSGYRPMGDLAARINGVHLTAERRAREDAAKNSGNTLRRSIIEFGRASAARDSVDVWRSASETDKSSQGAFMASGRMQASASGILHDLREQGTFLNTADQRRVAELNSALAESRGALRYDSQVADRLATAILDVTERSGDPTER